MRCGSRCRTGGRPHSSQSRAQGAPGIGETRALRRPWVALGESLRPADGIVVGRPFHQRDQQQALFGDQVVQRPAIPRERGLFDALGAATERGLCQYRVDHAFQGPVTTGADGSGRVEEMPAQSACRVRLSHGQGPPRAAEQSQLGVEGGTLPSRELPQPVTPCAYGIEARHILNAARLDIQIERAQVGLGAVAVRLTVIGKVRCADRVETEAHRHDESGDNQQHPEDGSDPGHPRRWLQAASYAP